MTELQSAVEVTQADIEVVESIGSAMASYYEYNGRAKYDEALQFAAAYRQQVEAETVARIVVWLNRRARDYLHGEKVFAYGHDRALASAIEAGEWKGPSDEVR